MPASHTAWLLEQVSRSVWITDLIVCGSSRCFNDGNYAPGNSPSRRVGQLANGAMTEPVTEVLQLVGCPECDLLVRMAEPAAHEVARCPRCGYVLSIGIAGGFSRPLAYAVTALMLLGIALTFPFLTVTATGLSHDMTLAAAVPELSSVGAQGVAILFALLALVVPAAIMAAMVILTGLLLARRASPALMPLARQLFRLNPWAMADVFVVGVIVSLVKLATMADVLIGVAFWAYLGFTVSSLLAITSLDRISVFEAIEKIRARSAA